MADTQPTKRGRVQPRKYPWADLRRPRRRCYKSNQLSDGSAWSKPSLLVIKLSLVKQVDNFLRKHTVRITHHDHVHTHT